MVVPGVQIALGETTRVGVTVAGALTIVMFTVTVAADTPAMSNSTVAEYEPAGLLAATGLGLNVSGI